MHRLLIALIFLAVAGCQGETARPTPTGKGSVRMINALDNAPDVTFLIEEQALQTVPVRQGSGFARWDDFSYVFNFETSVIGELQSRRIASREVKLEADRDYTLLLTGSFDGPSVTVWDNPERVFDGTESVFEARIAHLSPTAGPVDFYVLPASSTPAPGAERGTLDFGDTLDPIDIEEGDYVLTVTEAGNPANVLFESSEGAYVAGNVATFALFDGTEVDTAPHVVQLIGNNGGGAAIRDVRFGPTVRFFQASFSLTPADVYDDEALTSLVLSDHQFGDISGDLPIDTGTTTFTYTATGNTSVVLFETDASASRGLPYNLIVTGDDDNRGAQVYVPNRRSVSTESRLEFFQASANHPEVDVYAVERDAGFTGSGQILRRLDLGSQTANLFDARNVDLYVTPFDTDTVLAGPVPVDLALGDVVELIVLDTVDPATVELRVVPPP